MKRWTIRPMVGGYRVESDQWGGFELASQDQAMKLANILNDRFDRVDELGSLVDILLDGISQMKNKGKTT